MCTSYGMLQDHVNKIVNPWATKYLTGHAGTEHAESDLNETPTHHTVNKIVRLLMRESNVPYLNVQCVRSEVADHPVESVQMIEAQTTCDRRQASHREDGEDGKPLFWWQSELGHRIYWQD